MMQIMPVIFARQLREYFFKLVDDHFNRRIAHEELERKLVRLPSMNKVARRIVRIMVGYATEIDMDANGRILVSKELREFASLEKQGMLIGQGNKFEFWDEATWNEKRDAWLLDEDDSDMPADLESISF